MVVLIPADIAGRGLLSHASVVPCFWLRHHSIASASVRGRRCRFVPGSARAQSSVEVGALGGAGWNPATLLLLLLVPLLLLLLLLLLVPLLVLVLVLLCLLPLVLVPLLLRDQPLRKGGNQVRVEDRCLNASLKGRPQA
jgi:hypothetical protein